MKANEEEREKLLKLLKEGKVEWPEVSKGCFERRISTDKPDFAVVEAHVKFWGPYERKQGGMEISWGTVSAGFGILTIFLDKDGTLKADTEMMGKEFCKKVLCKLVDSWSQCTYNAGYLRCFPREKD